MYVARVISCYSPSIALCVCVCVCVCLIQLFVLNFNVTLPGISASAAGHSDTMPLKFL